jgi:uncharacterized protein YegP (UPF0339 family)
MTGMFELFTDPDASYRFRLTAPDGTVMALSRPFPDRGSAVAGIAAVREYAGMGLVAEITAPHSHAVRQSVAEAARPPIIRFPSAARFLGVRAVLRNQQMIVRWRQSLGTRTAPAGLSTC